MKFTLNDRATLFFCNFQKAFVAIAYYLSFEDGNGEYFQK
jgi:hypothetical protein